MPHETSTPPPQTELQKMDADIAHLEKKISALDTEIKELFKGSFKWGERTRDRKKLGKQLQKLKIQKLTYQTKTRVANVVSKAKEVKFDTLKNAAGGVVSKAKEVKEEYKTHWPQMRSPNDIDMGEARSVERRTATTPRDTASEISTQPPATPIEKPAGKMTDEIFTLKLKLSTESAKLEAINWELNTTRELRKNNKSQTDSEKEREQRLLEERAESMKIVGRISKELKELGGHENGVTEEKKGEKKKGFGIFKKLGGMVSRIIPTGKKEEPAPSNPAATPSNDPDDDWGIPTAINNESASVSEAPSPQTQNEESPLIKALDNLELEEKFKDQLEEAAEEMKIFESTINRGDALEFLLYCVKIESSFATRDTVKPTPEWEERYKKKIESLDLKFNELTTKGKKLLLASGLTVEQLELPTREVLAILEQKKRVAVPEIAPTPAPATPETKEKGAEVDPELQKTLNQAHAILNALEEELPSNNKITFDIFKSAKLKITEFGDLFRAIDMELVSKSPANQDAYLAVKGYGFKIFRMLEEREAALKYRGISPTIVNPPASAPTAPLETPAPAPLTPFETPRQRMEKAIARLEQIIATETVKLEAINKKLEMIRATKKPKTPVVEETPTSPEKKESKPYPARLIEDLISSELRKLKMVKEVQRVKVEGKGNEINLSIRVLAKKGFTVEVGVQGVLENKNGKITVKNYQIEAGGLIKPLVESYIVPELDKIEERLREYLEKQEGDKVEKMEIVNGELKVTFT